MQEVHTFIRLGVRPTSARTVWMFGFQRRLVRRWEWEMLCPKLGPLPHTSQLAATGNLLQIGNRGLVFARERPRLNQMPPRPQIEG